MEDKKQPQAVEHDTNKTMMQPSNKPKEADSDCCERIRVLILAQQNELNGLQLTIDQIMRDMEDLKKRRKIVKKALKTAKVNKLDKKKTVLIADDLKAIKEDRSSLKAMIKEKTQQAENLERLIVLLEALI